MIRLTSAATKLQFKTSVAVTTNELPIVVSYSDKTSSHYIGSTQTTTSTGSTLIDICSPPTSPAIRDIDTITIFNADTTSKLIYVYFLNGNTTYTIISATLAVGDKLEYIHGNGWKTTDSTGAIKSTGGGGASITTINTDTTAVQTLTTGTTGADFAIVDDLVGDHKFNLPTASAVNRGALSSADWTTFNSKVTSVSGTLNRITSSGGATPVIDIDANYVGQASLTTLGTITTGTWNAGIISPVYGGTGVANNVASTITVTGSFATTFTISAITTVTLPTSGTLYGTLAGSITSAQMLSSMSDETGTGALTFATSPTFTTDITTPLIIGGTAVGSGITFKSTTGIGTATGIAAQFTGGTNGATVLSTQYNDGQFLIGTTTRIGGTLGNTRLAKGTTSTDFGEISAGISAIWTGLALATVPTTTNYAIKGNANGLFINAVGGYGVELLIANVTQARWFNGGCYFTPQASASNTAYAWRVTAPANTNQITGVNTPDIDYNLTATKQWATGALPTQTDVIIRARTYAFVAASTVTNGATLAITGAPIAGTNATITNSMALWVQGGTSRFGGNIILDSTLRLKNYTVATLPAGVQGDKAFVTDALAPTYLVTVAGGGTVVTEVFYNGTNWVCT